ncbi:MAG: glycosyltransferase family 4 protein [Candidatus Sumerlaeia bacterium]|nr:glycosyltransferase family 4 protein [Candidatus Sumerlaeia bacterium]
MTKKILIDARYLDGTYSGIATYSRCLIEHLARIDTTNRYYVVIRPGFRENLRTGPNFEFLTYRPRPISLPSYLRFHEHVEEIAPDIVHSLAPHVPVFWSGPMLVTVHDLQPFLDPDFSAKRTRTLRALYNLFYRWAYPTTIAKAKWVICDSHATRDDVARLLPGSLAKLIVVPPGIEPVTEEPPSPARIESIRAKANIPGRYFLYYGSTRPNKNLPNLVKAFARALRELGDEGQDLRLVLVLRRDRFFRDIARAIHSRQLDDRVLVLDPIPNDERQALLAGALAFVFPSKYEGFGFPPLEAMQLDVPVLGGTSGALPEVLGDGALLVDPDSLDDIAAGLTRLARDAEHRQDLIARGRRQVARFDWDECAQRIHDIYNLLV